MLGCVQQGAGGTGIVFWWLHLRRVVVVAAVEVLVMVLSGRHCATGLHLFPCMARPVCDCACACL